MRKLVGLAVVLAVASIAAADVLWDNNIEEDGINGRAISPPGFPNIRVADDFVVDGAGWLLENVNYSAAENHVWIWDDGDGIEVTVYADNDGHPGEIVAQRAPGGRKIFYRHTFIFDFYYYWAEFENDPIVLKPGTYWVGVRHPTARGSGSNFWMTSDGGPDGGDSSTGYFSLDSGNTWTPEGNGWHHTFVLSGREVPEPTTLALLTVGGLAVLRPRRRL